MIEFFRRATETEVEAIKDKSDLTPTSAVWTWPNEKGEPDTGVLRNCTELDPVHFGATSGNTRKAMFFWGIANMLKATGITEIYFNIDADSPEEYKNILTRLGAVPTTDKPQIRYKLVL